MTEDRRDDECRGPVTDSGPDAEPSLAEQAELVDRHLSCAVAQVIDSLNGGEVPFEAAPAMALILIGARSLRDLGWSQEQALGAVVDGFEGDLDARGLRRPVPN